MDKLSEIKRLWREAFNDSRTWMTEVFPRIYRDEDSLVINENGSVACMLMLRRCSLNYQGIDLPAAYIYGAATDRRLRGRGYMSTLLKDALAEARRRGDAIAIVKPARPRLFKFYGERGFVTTFFSQDERYTSAHRFTYDKDAFLIETHAHDAEEVAAAYNRLNALRRPAFVSHNGADFKTILLDNTLDSGCTIVVRDAENATIRALSFATATPTEINVRDLIADGDEAASAALAEVSAHFPGLMTIVDGYPFREGIKLHRRAMARIVNVEAVLAAFASLNPKLKMRIKVNDEILAENTAFYSIADGKVTVDVSPDSNEEKAEGDASGKPHNAKTSAKPDLEITVETLTSIAFSTPRIGEIFNLSTCRPWMSLMLD